MAERRRVLFERNALKELFYFGNVLRREETYYALSFRAADKAREAAEAIKKKMLKEGRDLLSLEVLEEPVSFLPFSAITIIVRTPATGGESTRLGALISVPTLAFTALLVALGLILWSTVEKLEKGGALKLVSTGMVILGVASILREGRLLFSERG